MDLLNSSTDWCPHNFLNTYSGITLPSLPVSILYGIFTVFLLTCISRSAVINNCLFFKYTEFILTYFYFFIFLSHLHLMNCMVFPALAHLLKMAHFTATSACLSMCWTLPQCSAQTHNTYHGQCGDALYATLCPACCCATFTQLNLWESVMSLSIAACILCASTLLAQISTSSLVVWSLLPLAVSSLITSSSIVFVI